MTKSSYLARTTFAFMAMVLTVSPVEFAVGQTAAPAPAGVCADLASQWDRVEKNLASNSADEIGDNSAPRATLRNIEDLTGMTTANLLYAMIKDNKCPLPKSAPQTATYFASALTCASDRLKTASPESCKRETWTKAGK